MPQLMWCVYLCVCALQWATYMASAFWMLRAWWRRLSAGNKFPRSVSVWRRPPSSWEGIRPAALRERSPLWVGASPWFLRFYRTLSISVSAPASGSSHTDSHTHFNGCHFLYCSSACVSLPCFFFWSLLSHLCCSLRLFYSSPSPHRAIHPGSVLTSVYESAGCSGRPLQRVVYVEHVVVRVTITHGHRGDLSITLASPSGTVSQLLSNR